MSDEGHLKKHKTDTFSYSDNTFNDHPGYESMEEAMKAIEDYENSLPYACVANTLLSLS